MVRLDSTTQPAQVQPYSCGLTDLITGSVLEWFKSYPTGRTQTVTISSDTSAAVPLVCSVPQGSVVGTPLFIAYMGDLEVTIDVYSVEHDLYADDTQLLSHMCVAVIQHRRSAIENYVLAIQDCVRKDVFS